MRRAKDLVEAMRLIAGRWVAGKAHGNRVDHDVHTARGLREIVAVAAKARPPATRVARQLVAVIALTTAIDSSAEGTQLVRRASTPLADAYQDRRQFPRELSIDALSESEIAKIKQGIKSYLQKHPPGRADGIEGCMQWVFLRHGADEPWAAVGYSLPWLGGGAVKINGALRRANLNFSIAPMFKAQGTVSVPGTRPGSGAIFVAPLAERSDFALWLSKFDSDRDSAMRNLEGNSVSTQWSLRIAPVSDLKVSLPRARCTLLAAECRQYVSVVDDDARWLPSGGAPGVGRSPPKVTAEPIPLAPGLRTELAIEDMCPFSRQGMVEGPVNTRAHPVERGINAFGIPGNASLSAALSKN